MSTSKLNNQNCPTKLVLTAFASYLVTWSPASACTACEAAEQASLAQEMSEKFTVGDASPKISPAQKSNVGGSKLLFEDSMTGNWRDKWFLDGTNATVENRDNGLFFSGGTVTKQDDPNEYHAHHAVLWTKDVFEGDLKISYEMTRIDTSDYGNTLLYIQAQGVGSDLYSEDITEWNAEREIPAMSEYFTYMNLVSLSFRENLRCKLYPLHKDESISEYEKRGEVLPRADYIGMIPGKTYRVLVEKTSDSLRLQLFDADTGEEYIDNTWDLKMDGSFEPQAIQKGRIGLRHMATKQFIYKNFEVEQL